MSDEECAWDADDFDPDAGFAKADDKWDGEDENLEIPVASTEKDADAPSKPRKSKAERIDEKKAARRKGEEENSVQLTEAEEKLRKLALQKEADLGSAMELFGGATMGVPKSPEEFSELGKTLAGQIAKFDAMPGYFNLLESLVRDSCLSLDAEDCRKLGSVLTALAQEKSKLAKEKKGPAKKKGKKLNLSKGSQRGEEFDLTGNGAAGGHDYDDFDFM